MTVAGCYRLDHLIERYGIDARQFDWSDEIMSDQERGKHPQFKKKGQHETDLCEAGT